MRASWLAAMWVVLGMGMVGNILNRLAQPIGTEVRRVDPVPGTESLAASVGHGVILAVLGGYRGLVANGVWLHMHEAWERGDRAATEARLQLATAVDPWPVVFWLNGARILADDFSFWRITAAGGHGALPAGLQAQIQREQAAVALRWLERALQHHPHHADLWCERARIELRGLGDVAGAAASYRRAWECPSGPEYAARMHAGLLVRLGRREEALSWRAQIHAHLPTDDPATDSAAVRERIPAGRREVGAGMQNSPPPR